MARNEEQQNLFALEYIKDFNATKAAIRAGYSEKTAGSQAHDLLKKPDIQARVNKHIGDRIQRTQITTDMVIEELSHIAFARTTDAVYVKDGTVRIKETSEISERSHAALESIKETVGKDGSSSISVKFHNKEKALELLGKHLGMFEDRLEISGNVKKPLRMIIEDYTTDDMVEDDDDESDSAKT